MIIIISGGVGSGKSLTAVKCAIEESKKNKIYTNFKLKKIKNYHRLRWDDVILTDEKDIPYSVNWDYWEKTKGVDIFLDELHNIVSSRNSMSKQSRYFSEWISQIRKIWGGQGDQNYLTFLKKLPNNAFNQLVDEIISRSNNIYLVTQRTRKIDVNFRELCHVYIQCEKKMINNKVVIFNYYWFGDDNNSALDYQEMGVRPKISYFIGDNYFSYYDSYELISTGGEYL